MTTEPVRIVDVTAPESGWRLQVFRRSTQQCDAILSSPDGNTACETVLYPDAPAAIDSAVAHLVHGMRPALPHVASALRVSAMAELR